MQRQIKIEMIHQKYNDNHSEKGDTDKRTESPTFYKVISADKKSNLSVRNFKTENQKLREKKVRRN